MCKKFCRLGLLFLAVLSDCDLVLPTQVLIVLAAAAVAVDETGIDTDGVHLPTSFTVSLTVVHRFFPLIQQHKQNIYSTVTN